MRLSEIYDDYIKFDKERKARNFKPALKVQQAVAELDGWELELTPPKPMDIDTGEVFHWTGTAVHEPDGNKVPVVINGDHGGHVSFNCGTSSFSVGLDLSTEEIGSRFLKFYEQQLTDTLNFFRDDFEFSLDGELPDLVDSVDEEDIPMHAKTKIYTPFINDWLKNPASKSDGLVNSLKLAKDLESKIYEEWTDVLQDRIEHHKDQAETDERDGQKDSWGGQG